jgi:hypothetical protein
MQSKAIFLKRFPHGSPRAEDFELRNIALPALKDGEMQMRTIWMSVDPYMRGRMRPDIKSYIPPFSLDAPLDGGAVSEVVESRQPDWKPGDLAVAFQGGWKDQWISNGDGLTRVSAELAPLSSYLGVLGMPGLTAWAGLTQIIKPQPGETVFVSGAAGAVGSLVCQIAKLKGARVVGSAGGPEKCGWVKDKAGADAVIDYKTCPDASALTAALEKAAPGGVNGYFENVGGAHLEAALNCIAFGARIALCGMISVYNATKPEPGPWNLVNLIGRGAMMEGFIVSKYLGLAPQFFGEIAPLVAARKIAWEETVYEGLQSAPDAFLGLFSGANLGKAVVRVGPHPA